jgi:hypothetical protein
MPPRTSSTPGSPRWSRSWPRSVHDPPRSRRSATSCRDAYRQLQIDIEPLRRRIFVSKAERVDTRQLELEFASKKRELDALARRLGVEPPPLPPRPDETSRRRRQTPKGRRNLAVADLAVERHELLDAELERIASRRAPRWRRPRSTGAELTTPEWTSPPVCSPLAVVTRTRSCCGYNCGFDAPPSGGTSTVRSCPAARASCGRRRCLRSCGRAARGAPWPPWTSAAPHPSPAHRSDR